MLKYTKGYNYNLQDVNEPNLFREIFPYEEVCRITFDNKILPLSPPKEIFITDTTFRDGQQARPPYTVKQIVDIYDMLHQLGGPHGVIRQSEFFIYSNRDKKAVEMCLEKGYKYPEVTGWIRAHKDDLKLIKEIGLQETGILTSVSDYHIFLKLEKNRNQAMKDYLMIVNTAIELGITPRCHFEDLTRADIYGFCVPFAIELMKIRENTGVNIKIRLCDTMGYGITYPGASLPRSVDKLVRAMIDDAGVPGELLEWHGHNDFHKVLINATTAWLYGCAGANGTLLGFGERTGNPPIEGLVMEYIGLNGDLNGIDTTVITQIARYFEKELGTHISKNYPFVGEDFNATSAGIHADGALKNEEVYNIFNTNKILKRPLGVIVNDKSGAAGIAYWINAHLGLEGEMRIDKRHPGISRIHKWVIQQYEAGRVTGISHNEIEKQARKHIPELFYSDFDRIKRKAYEISAHLLEDLIELDEIRSMNPELQESILKRFMEEDPFMQFIYITDLEGRKITKNITQIVDRAKYENFGLNEDFSNRSWFIEPLKNGKVHVTNLYTSKITSALCITVSGPIRNEEEEIVGILGMDLKFEDLARMVEEEDGD